MVSELTAVRTAADLKAPISGSSSLAGVNCPGRRALHHRSTAFSASEAMGGRDSG